MALMTKIGLTQWLLVALLCAHTLHFVSGKALVRKTEGSPSSQRDSPHFKPHKSFTSHLHFALQHGASLKLDEKRTHLPQKSKAQPLPLHRQTRQLSDPNHLLYKFQSWLSSLLPSLTTRPAEPEPNPTPEPGYPCCFPV